MVILREQDEVSNNRAQFSELDLSDIDPAQINALNSLAKREVLQAFSLADISHPLMQTMIEICIERRVAALVKQSKGTK